MFDPDVSRRVVFCLTLAWLLPAVGCVLNLCALRWTHRLSRAPSHLALGLLTGSLILSVVSLCDWLASTELRGLQSGHADTAGTQAGTQGRAIDTPGGNVEAHTDSAARPPSPALIGTYYRWARFGPLEISIDYYIDGLTVVLFVLVTAIAWLVHLYASGYLKDELTEEYEDSEAIGLDGRAVRRPGRYHIFFAELQLFCWAMLGLLLSGNLLQVFVFWELVGLCSYLLIGFYTERPAANAAASKAFLMNRVGDCGFLIALMVLWSACGTLRFVDPSQPHGPAGVLTAFGGPDGQMEILTTDDSVVLQRQDGGVWQDSASQPRTLSYGLCVLAGLGLIAGSLGKSAQFPLLSWLPDAMEGPTPVSALVHSATMVAAGVYLAARCSPLFVPEVLMVVAALGCLTLFIGASCAAVAHDIKRVLAYSTISQLGYMLLAVGVGAGELGLFHLVTHGCFKALLFLGCGSVILACHHHQNIKELGGLRRRLPITAATMLVGAIALSGLSVPGFSWLGWQAGFSGYFSKDAILAAVGAFVDQNADRWPLVSGLIVVPLIGAGLTSYYAFRMWWLVFSGEPRVAEIYDQAREPRAAIVLPLVVLAIAAVFVGSGGEHGVLASMVHSGVSPHPQWATVSAVTQNWSYPLGSDVAAVHGSMERWAWLFAMTGLLAAYLLYGRRSLSDAETDTPRDALSTFLIRGWRLDEVAQVIVVQPATRIAKWCVWIDAQVFDVLVHRLARGAVHIAGWDRWVDEAWVDGVVRQTGEVTQHSGQWLSTWQTGRLRQYVLYLAAGVAALVLIAWAALPVT
jgi:NADH-quinone oxidoreductase subunit L